MWCFLQRAFSIITYQNITMLVNVISIRRLFFSLFCEIKASRFLGGVGSCESLQRWRFETTMPRSATSGSSSASISEDPETGSCQFGIEEASKEHLWIPKARTTDSLMVCGHHEVWGWICCSEGLGGITLSWRSGKYVEKSVLLPCSQGTTWHATTRNTGRGVRSMDNSGVYMGWMSSVVVFCCNFGSQGWRNEHNAFELPWAFPYVIVLLKYIIDVYILRLLRLRM